MKKLMLLLDELETKIPFSEKINPRISKSNAGWHIEHSLLTISQIIKGMELSDPSKYKWEFSLPRAIVYMIKKIPRGRGKAPAIVQPTGEINRETLLRNLKLVKERLNVLSSLHPDSYIVHPYFKHLNLKPTIKFLGLHTHHHIKIINDIIKK